MANHGNSVLLVGSRGDSVILDPMVRREGVGGVSLIQDPASALTFELASGDSLRIAGDTPPGTYSLFDGGRVVLGPELGYPRSYTFAPAPSWVLQFEVRSNRRIGVLVTETLSSTAPQGDAAATKLFRERAQYRSARLMPNAPLAFAVPSSWYRRAWIEVPNAPASYRVLFFAYGSTELGAASAPTAHQGRVRYSGATADAALGAKLPDEAPLEIIGELLLNPDATGSLQAEKVR
jgi:hypothetical protein